MKKLNTCKKLISSILVVAMLSFGCSDIVHITKDEFNEGYFEDGEKREIYLTTKDSSRYHFLKDYYSIRYDTLYGKGEQIAMEGNETEFSGKIAMEDIESLEGKEINVLYTAYVLIAIIKKIIRS